MRAHRHQTEDDCAEELASLHRVPPARQIIPDIFDSCLVPNDALDLGQQLSPRRIDLRPTSPRRESPRSVAAITPKNATNNSRGVP